MATLYKRNGRKMLAASRISVGYANLSSPGLLQKKHISLTLGDYFVRVEEDQAVNLANEILATVARYKDEK